MTGFMTQFEISMTVGSSNGHSNSMMRVQRFTVEQVSTTDQALPILTFCKAPLLGVQRVN